MPPLIRAILEECLKKDRRDRIGDVDVLPEGRFNLTQFDPEPPQFDLPIDSTHKLQPAVAAPANPIARSIKTLPGGGTKRI